MMRSPAASGIPPNRSDRIRIRETPRAFLANAESFLQDFSQPFGIAGIYFLTDSRSSESSAATRTADSGDGVMLRQTTAALAALLAILATHSWLAGPDRPPPMMDRLEALTSRSLDAMPRWAAHRVPEIPVAAVAPAAPLIPDPLSGQSFLAERAWAPPGVDPTPAPEPAEDGALAALAALAPLAAPPPLPQRRVSAAAEPVEAVARAPALEPAPRPARKPERSELAAILGRTLALPVPSRRPQVARVPETVTAAQSPDVPEPTPATLLLSPADVPTEALRLDELIRRSNIAAAPASGLEAGPAETADYTLADALDDAAWRRETALRLQGDAY